MHYEYCDINGATHIENDNDVVACIPVESNEHLIDKGIIFSDLFNTYRVLLTDTEILSGLKDKFPEAIVSMFLCDFKRAGLVQCVKLSFPSAQLCFELGFAPYFDSHECCRHLKDIVRQKFSGDKKYIATHDEQSLLIALGIIKNEHANYIGEAALEQLLAHDLGL